MSRTLTATTTPTKRYITAGQRVTVRLPWSEACMHLRVADKRMPVQLLPGGMVQVHDANGGPVSFPITAGEAGIYLDAGGYFYTHTE